MKDPTYPAFTTMFFFGFLVALLPLAWLRPSPSNLGVFFYMFWLAVACLNQFINSIVWHGSAINYSPIWCDICKSFQSSGITTTPTMVQRADS